jgi:hypothetical protein
MIFDINEIITFSECPMKFYFKHILKDEKYNIDNKYQKDMLNIIYSLFDMIQIGQINIRPLKAIWGKKWINKKSKQNFIYEIPKSWRDSFSAYQKKGIESIVFLFNEYSNKGYKPLIINSPYLINLSNDTKIKGTFHVVAEKDNQIELMIFRSFKLIDRWYLQNDFEATISALAFRTLFKQKENKITLNCFERKKIITEIKTNDQIKTVIKDVNNIINCINNSLFFRSVNEGCFYCQFKKECVKTYDLNNKKIEKYILEKA